MGSESDMFAEIFQIGDVIEGEIVDENSSEAKTSDSLAGRHGERIKIVRKEKDFTQIPNQLFKQGRFLSSNAKWTYAALKSFRNSRTELTFPSYDAIMERSGLSRPKVAAGLSELEEFDWIQKTKHFSKSTDYTFTFPVVWSEDDTLAIDQTCPTKGEAKWWAELQKKRKNRGRPANVFKQIAAKKTYDDDDSIPF